MIGKKGPRQGPDKWPRCPKHPRLPMPPVRIHNCFVVEHQCRVKDCPSNFIVELA